MKAKRKKKYWSLQTKLLLSNVLAILVLISALLIYFYFYVVGREEINALRNLDTLSSQIGQQLDATINNMDKTALQIGDNPYIVYAFQQLPADEPGNHFDQELLYKRELVRYVDSYNFKKNTTARICLYNNNEDFIYSGTRITSPQAVANYFKSSEFSALHNYYKGESANFSYFIPPREDPFADTTDRKDDQPLFSIVREIKNYDTLRETKTLGYVEVQHPLTHMSELFDSLNPHISGCILNDNNEIIYTTAEAKQSAQFLAVYQELANDQPADVSQITADDLISSASINEMPLTVVLVQSRDYAVAPLKFFGLMLFAVAILIIFLVAGTEYLILRHLTKPLISLQNKLGDLNIFAGGRVSDFICKAVLITKFH